MPSGSPSSSLSHSSVAHQCIACTIALSKRSSHATVQPVGSISHDALLSEECRVIPSVFHCFLSP